MLTPRSLIVGLFLSGTAIVATAQNQALTSGAALTVPTAYGINASATATAESKKDYLPYAEPILGLDKEAYENHFDEYRVGSLMDRVLDLNELELQAIYADSKMHEINVAFNAKKDQELVVNIYDQYGMKVKSELHTLNTGINNYKINTEDLEDGFYSLVVIGNNEQFIQRFIIE